MEVPKNDNVQLRPLAPPVEVKYLWMAAGHMYGQAQERMVQTMTPTPYSSAVRKNMPITEGGRTPPMAAQSDDEYLSERGLTSTEFLKRDLEELRQISKNLETGRFDDQPSGTTMTPRK